MLSAAFLLFEKPFEGQPLFKNQFDLVQQLLTTPPYFLSEGSTQEQQKAQTRLKTYISQLLSETVVRTITEDFKKAMSVLLMKKIKDAQVRNDTFAAILKDLNQKNAPLLRSESKALPKNNLQIEMAEASYVSIITANPISVETPSRITGAFSLRHLFIEDLMLNLSTKEAPLKTYRFSFPMETHCEIFWIAFQQTLVEYLNVKMDDKNFIDTLYNKFTIKTSTHSLVERYLSKPTNTTDEPMNDAVRFQLLEALSRNIIELLNRNKHVTTHLVTEPVYTVPVLVLNPNELGAGKMYLIVEDENKSVNVIKSTRENLLIWTLFVWDRIKASKTSKDVPAPFIQSV